MLCTLLCRLDWRQGSPAPGERTGKEEQVMKMIALEPTELLRNSMKMAISTSEPERLTQLPGPTIFSLEDVVRATLTIARECDLTSDSPNQFLIKLVASVVAARLQKGASHEKRNH
jgi:hypothetical protein